ncbi:unnamed protein product [Sphenostylis stenocarpa]|uniref:Uncharacterized protein n=1 Tax=Sphenostylis stenocarpa TaxID=92480 RepID=A0AA86STZ8_9FABA|nr:unnamed protein product [Sphenostylis stenocarpa]
MSINTTLNSNLEISPRSGRSKSAEGLGVHSTIAKSRAANSLFSPPYGYRNLSNLYWSSGKGHPLLLRSSAICPLKALPCLVLVGKGRAELWMLSPFLGE